MMHTIRDRITEYLAQHPEGIDDDELARALGLKQRQQANSRCRQLEAKGILERHQVRGKIHNFLVDTVHLSQPYREPENASDETKPWFWEGNVQQAVVNYLESQKYTILQAVNTASHQQGKDIITESSGGLLWITVKGYPKGTTRTHPTVQAGHWFKEALFDIVRYRGEDAEVALAIALPDFPRYRRLTYKVSWFQPVARFSYFWVNEDGTVNIE